MYNIIKQIEFLTLKILLCKSMGRSRTLKIGMKIIWTHSVKAGEFEPIYSNKCTLLVDAALLFLSEVSVLFPEWPVTASPEVIALWEIIDTPQDQLLTPASRTITILKSKKIRGIACEL